MVTKAHHYFLLSPRPWPLLVRILSFNSFFSFLIFMKYSSYLVFLVNILGTSLGAMYWWFSYRREFNLEGKQSTQLDVGVKNAMVLFISSEVFFFFSFFWSYFHFSLSPAIEIGMSWPPVLTEIFDFSNVPIINTIVLLLSGVAVTVRHHMIDQGRLKASQSFLFLTCILGLIFTALQLIEYNRSFFRIRDRAFGTSFFILTGFHGIHVLIGTIYLLISLTRGLGLSMAKDRYTSFELSSWYWHFVDVVWIFLFFFLYYLNC